MEITLYQFSKRQNSTSRPPLDTPFKRTFTTAKINDANTSILNPQIKISPSVHGQQGDETINVLNFNYCYIPSFNRFYYIQNWEFNGDGTWTADCQVDVLASWRSAILGSSGYVGRSSNITYQDKFVMDMFYPTTAKCRVKVETYPTGMEWNINNGSFVIGVLSGQAPNIGTVSYYVIRPSQLAVLVNKMIGTAADPFSDFNGFLGDVGKSIVDPFRFIVSCKWYPFDIYPDEQDPHIPPLGDLWLYCWNTTAKVRPVPSTWKSFPDGAGAWRSMRLYDIDSFGSFPEGTDFHRWPCYPPYAQYNMITPWGTFDLDANYIANNLLAQSSGGYVTIEYRIMVSLVDGTGTLEVRANSRTVGEEYMELLRREIKVALDIPLAQLTTDYFGALQSIMGGAAAFGTGVGSKDVGGAISGLFETINGVTSLFSPAVQSSASNVSSFTPAISNVYLQSQRFQTVEQNNDLFGRPVKRYIEHLSSLKPSEDTVYVKLDFSYFNSTCTQTEHDQIISFLMNGVFLE